MGCHCSQTKDFEQEEESLINQCETLLGYRDYPASRICTEVLVLTVNEKLNWNRLKQLGQVLDLNLSGFEASDEPLSKFYTALKTGNAWDAYKLGLIGILLGKGQAEAKADLAFSLYDKEYLKVIPATKVVQMVEDLCGIAFDHLPNFTKLMLERQGNTESADLLQSYMDRLSEAKVECVRFLSKLLIGDNEVELTCEVFSERACHSKASCLFDARSLRTQGMDHYKLQLRSQMRKRSQSLRPALSV